jgi:hypothetical protein
MKIKILLFPVLMLFIISCKKNSSTNTQPHQDTYLTTTAGSTWNYHQIDSSGSTPVNTDYTLTSSSRDTLINGKSYHIYNNSTGSFQYLSLTSNDYFQFDSLPAGLGTAVFERLYLKDNVNVGNSWTQSLTITVPGIPFSIPITLTYQIAEKGISRTVNAQTYTDVIHVSATISSSLIPSANLTSSINSYYAKKYGLIENTTIINLNYTGIIENVNIETKIVSATLL